jgi:4-oxalmesaconate hydratase
MIIDAHAHLVAPDGLYAYRANLIADGGYHHGKPQISDEALAKAAAGNVAIMDSVGTDVQLLSPRPFHLGTSMQPSRLVAPWVRANNDTIARTVALHPGRFAGVGALPLVPGQPVSAGFAELDRIVDMRFVGVLLNPDLDEGRGTTPHLGDRYWYPLYEKLVELDVPAMIHVSAACNPAFHTTGSHYLNGDTAAFMQCLTSDLFKNFPTLKFIIPHGGGAVPYHWGRFRGIAQDMKLPPLTEHLLKNVFFDTCVYHLPGQELLAKVIPLDNILFASEMIGAVRGIDPETGHHYDDTKRYVEQLFLSAGDKAKLYDGNARRVYGRLSAQLGRQGVH